MMDYYTETDIVNEKLLISNKIGIAIIKINGDFENLVKYPLPPPKIYPVCADNYI